MTRHSLAALTPAVPAAIVAATTIAVGLARRRHRDITRPIHGRPEVDRSGAGRAAIALVWLVMSITMGCDAYCSCNA
ncbi:hypothetical protein WK32_27775 [Burkholderia vietnamiensis]|nr:hypothetical protein WK32_27775 [Burkholderia vietnamiensis]